MLNISGGNNNVNITDGKLLKLFNQDSNTALDGG